MPTTEELLKQAQALNEAKRYDEVIALLTDELLKEHNSADLYAEKAQAYYRTGQNELCVKTVNNALTISPNAKAYHYKGAVYIDLKKYEEAIIAFKKALDVDPKFPYPYNSLGNIYRDQKDYKNAINSYQKALEIDPEFLYPHIGLGNVYRDQKDYENAQASYQKAIELAPGFAPVYNALGILYRRQKKYSDAQTALKKAIEFDSKYSYAYANLGDIYYDLENYDKAKIEYQKAIKLNPNDAYSYNGLGNIHYDLKKFDEAVKLYQQAIDVDATYSPPYYNRALVYYDLEKYADALVDFEKKIELTKNNPDVYTERAKERVDELKKLLESLDYRNISDLVAKIKILLLHKDGCVTHYTGFTIAKLLILERSVFRISEGAFLNDTSEGRALFDFIDFHSATSKQLKDTEAKPFAQKPFIGSFVAETKHDDLALWRMYGKDNKEDAKGCAITIDAGAFIGEIEKKLFPDGKTNTSNDSGDDLKFYRVAYQTPDNHFIIPGRKEDEDKLNELMKDLKHRISEFNENIKDKEDRDTQIKNVLELLNSIAYLFKSAEYQYEQELRLVVKKGIGFDKIVVPDTELPKVYIELVEITPHIRKITFGPKVDKRDEWAAIFYYTLEKSGHKPDIYISHLPFK